MKAFSLPQVFYICQWLSDQFSSVSSQEEADVLIQPIQIMVTSNAQHSPHILAPSNTVEESSPKVVLFTKKELVVDSEGSNSGVETVVTKYKFGFHLGLLLLWPWSM